MAKIFNFLSFGGKKMKKEERKKENKLKMFPNLRFGNLTIEIRKIW